MTFKEKAVAALRDAYESDCGPCRTVIRECMELVENLPDIKHENEKCAAPDYEAMYCETREELMEVYQRKHDARGGFSRRILLISKDEG